MGLSNAEIQARWRKRRNAEAKLARNVLAPSRDVDPSGELSQEDRGSAIMKLIASGGISQEDREAAIMKLLTMKGAAWAPGFVTWLSKWKPGKTKVRRRKPIGGQLLTGWPDLKLEPLDLKLEPLDHKLTDFGDVKLLDPAEYPDLKLPG
jgi:hypothetical protein